jgi:hypothetical protein
MVQDYLARPAQQREQTLIVTGVNEDRREINERIRQALRSEQVLKGPEAQAIVRVQRDLTRAELTQAKSYQIGDIVRFGRSYARLGIGTATLDRLPTEGIERGVVELQRGAQSCPGSPGGQPTSRCTGKSTERSWWVIGCDGLER